MSITRNLGLHGSRRLSRTAFLMRDNSLEFYRECERTAGIVETHFWRLPVYIVTDPELIEDVLVRQQSCFVKSGALRSAKRAFGQGLLTSDRQLWRQQRHIMQPAFHPNRVHGYRTTMDSAMEKLLASWGSGGERNIHRDMTDFCFEVLAVSLFGEDMSEGRLLIAHAADALHSFHDGYLKSIGSFGGLLYAMLRAVTTAAGRPDFVVDPSCLPMANSRKFRSVMDAVDAFVQTVISRRKRQPPRDDLLGMLLSARDESGRPLPPRQLRDEVVTMFFAGHETGAAALTWAFYLLARHTEVQAELVGQIKTGNDDELSNQVMREAMRLYPPAYRIGRTVVETCTLGGVKVKAGAELLIPQWAVHRSERYYEDPECFRPQRWTAEFSAHLPSFAYFPFGGGRRTCIGNMFGMIESKFVLNRVLRRFALTRTDPAEPALQMGVTLLPKDNFLKLTVKRRSDATLADREHQPAAAAARCPFHVAGD